MICRVKDITVYYEEIGQGKPIVMIHGYAPDHRLMTGCMEPVMRGYKNYRRIYLDLPGMGRSGSADWINGSDDMLDVVLRVLDRLIPSEHFLLVGESYGGYLARGILYQKREQIDGVLFICPVILPENEERNTPPHTALMRDTDFLAGLSPEEAEEFQESFIVQNEETYRRYQAEILPGIQAADHDFLSRVRKKYAFSFPVDKTEREEFPRPALFLLGRQDSCVGYQDAWEILRNYPRATFAVLDLAGHNLQIEQGKLFADLVKDWISRTEG
ncbi:alpha/beta fold hydrolase [Caproicibacter sp.]|uniref:alpha/beta fold hydrolase n=1 Tax=Caproicibacter sp. TaxID=2814884 RepID=UPI0039893EDD